MLKWFSMSFAILMLLQSTSISIADILRLDNLITHAQYHVDEYGDNLFVFISKHYGEQKTAHNKEHKHEQTQHEQLPFSHVSHHAAVVVFFLNADKLELKSSPILERKESNFFYRAPSSTAHTKGLLQPPRTA